MAVKTSILPVLEQKEQEKFEKLNEKVDQSKKLEDRATQLTQLQNEFLQEIVERLKLTSENDDLGVIDGITDKGILLIMLQTEITKVADLEKQKKLAQYLLTDELTKAMDLLRAL